MKKWYQSKTIGGIIIAAVGSLLMYFGVDTQIAIPDSPTVDLATQYVDQIKNAHGNLESILGVVLNGIGSGIALYGRVTAETIIGKPA